MPARVTHAHHQVATALIQVQGTGLEDGLALEGVEVGQVDEVAHQGEQVAPQAQQLFKQAQVLGGAPRLRIGLDERGDAPDHVTRDEVTQHGGVQVCHGRGGAGGEPIPPGLQPGGQGLPLLDAEGVGLAQHGRHHTVTQGADGGTPGGVEPVAQRQPGFGTHQCQRQGGDGSAIGGQQAGRQVDEVLIAGVQGAGGAGVKRRQAAAGEVILHLGLHGLEGRRCGRGVSTPGHHRAGRALALGAPVAHRLGGSGKCVQRGLVHPRFATAVQHATLRTHDQGDGG